MRTKALASLFLRRTRMHAGLATLAFLGVVFVSPLPGDASRLAAVAFGLAIAQLLRRPFLGFTTDSEYQRMLPVSRRGLFLAQLAAALTLAGGCLAMYWLVAKTGVLQGICLRLIPDHRYELLLFPDVVWWLLTAVLVCVSGIHAGTKERTAVPAWFVTAALLFVCRSMPVPTVVEWAVPVVIPVLTAGALPGSAGRTKLTTTLGVLVPIIMSLPVVLGTGSLVVLGMISAAGLLVPMPGGAFPMVAGLLLLMVAGLDYRASRAAGAHPRTALRSALATVLLVGVPSFLARRHERVWARCTGCRRNRGVVLPQCPFCGAAETIAPPERRSGGAVSSGTLEQAIVAVAVIGFIASTLLNLIWPVPLIHYLGPRESVQQASLDRIHLTVSCSPFFRIESEAMKRRKSWHCIRLRPPRVSELETDVSEFLTQPYADLPEPCEDLKATFHLVGLISGREWEGPFAPPERQKDVGRNRSERGHNVSTRINSPGEKEEMALFRETLARQPTLTEKVAYLRGLGMPAPYLVVLAHREQPETAERLLASYCEVEYELNNCSKSRAYRLAERCLATGVLPRSDLASLPWSATGSGRGNSSVYIHSPRPEARDAVTALLTALCKHGFFGPVERAFQRHIYRASIGVRRAAIEVLATTRPDRIAYATNSAVHSWSSDDDALLLGHHADSTLIALVEERIEHEALHPKRRQFLEAVLVATGQAQDSERSE